MEVVLEEENHELVSRAAVEHFVFAGDGDEVFGDID